MKKFLIPLLLVVAIGLAGILTARFLFGGEEDTWLCVDNQWIKHGNPSKQMPLTGCGETKDNWKQQTFDEVGLSFKIPSDTIFRKEIADDAGKIRTASFYIEKGKPTDNDFYQLFFVYQPNLVGTQQELEKIKVGMDPTTIKEVTINGYKGIEGSVTGPKAHFVTALLNNGKIYTISTWPPVLENKAITDQILATFSFK